MGPAPRNVDEAFVRPGGGRVPVRETVTVVRLAPRANGIVLERDVDLRRMSEVARTGNVNVARRADVGDGQVAIDRQRGDQAPKEMAAGSSVAATLTASPAFSLPRRRR